MVYVLNINGDPLMPCKEAKARKLLKSNKAKVIKKEPFTIQLLFECENQTQDITLGVDAGSRHIGLSATTVKKELYSADAELRNDIAGLISTRRQNRRTRRNRKTRHRKARFKNRKKEDGWLAPSIRQKIQCHLKAVEDVHKILPITKITVETAGFDIQKIKNPDIGGEEYQHGEQLGFWNVREYVLFRDGHTCQCCKGRSGDKILNVHHIESRKTGGDAPNNLITLCETCHSGYHNGTVRLPKTIHRGMRFRDAAFMGVMRWKFYEELKKIYPDVNMTYGYITKNTRIRNNLPKTHYVDARCISGNPLAEPLGYYYCRKKVRRHNRQIHKMNILKGGRRKRNQAEYLVKGFRLFDKVSYNGKPYFIFARRASGFFDIRSLSGEKVNNGSVSCKKLKLLETAKGYLTEARRQDTGSTQFLPPSKTSGFPCKIYMNTDMPDAIKDYDFTIEQEVLNEYAAGVWADYVSYCNANGIDIGNLDEPMAVKTQLVYEYKRKIIDTGECKTLEDLKPIKYRLKEMKDYLIKVKEKG